LSESADSKQVKAINPLELGAEELLTRESVGQWASIWREVFQSKAPVFATVMLVLLGLLAVFAPLLANHRPFVAADLVDGQRQFSFPLFLNLGATDWTLLALVFFSVWAIFWRKSLRRHQHAANRAVIILYVLFGLVAIPWSLAELPDNATMMPDSKWFYIGFGALALVGVAALLRGAVLLWSGATDLLGTDRSGSALRWMVIGPLMIIYGMGQFGTLNRPRLDTTDYYRKYVEKAKEGSWALFTPMPHNYAAQESYLRNQRPLGPHVDVIGSGGSDAAADLHLTKNTQWDTLANDVANGNPLTLDTPLSALRKGQGVRQHSRKRTDFVVVTGDLGKTRISIFGCKTVGDVINAMNQTAAKKPPPRFEAELVEGRGIVIHDLSHKRPIHLMGTDDNGSDVGARLVHASRVAASIGFVSTSIALLIGVTFGAVIGYFGGWVDYLGMRIIEVFMAIPRFFLLITIIAFIPPEYNQYMLYLMMVVIGLTSWMGAARFIRAEFFRLREVDYVQAAKACGLPLRSILLRHMLPNGVTPVLVDASFGVAAAIFLETGLSFLGFGIKPPEPSWGQMLSQAVNLSTGVFYWWLAIFPGIMIFLTVFSFNIIGDALRDAIDPKLKKASAL